MSYFHNKMVPKPSFTACPNRMYRKTLTVQLELLQLSSHSWIKVFTWQRIKEGNNYFSSTQRTSTIAATWLLSYMRTDQYLSGWLKQVPSMVTSHVVQSFHGSITKFSNFRLLNCIIDQDHNATMLILREGEIRESFVLFVNFHLNPCNCACNLIPFLSDFRVYSNNRELFSLESSLW